MAVALSDYNAIRQMLGYPPISLGAREFSTQWDAISTPEDQAAFLRNHPTLSTDAGTLSLAQDQGISSQVQQQATESMGETFYNLYTHVTYVLPDQVCHQLLPVMTKRYLATAHPIPYADAAALQDAFSTHYPEQSLQDGPEYSLDTRTQQISDTKSQIFLFHAVMVYGAVVLMVICAVVTPDASPVTMLLMFAAMIMLYEGSLLIARVVLRRRIKRQNEELAAEEDE